MTTRTTRTEASAVPKRIGRYTLYRRVASGGMASVYIGRLSAIGGFAKTVAIKRLHQQFATDPEFVAMFLDEARLAARIQHPNVVPPLDVVTADGELFLVMEYVRGESLAELLRMARRRGERIPIPVAVAILTDVLSGLHAAHEAKDELGAPLGIVHRDVSPQNVLVGLDGAARLVDFGVAKAVGRLATTREGQLKGKLRYMAPELFQRVAASARSDVYAAAVMAWELFAGRRLIDGDSEADMIAQILAGQFPAPSSVVPELPAALDAVIARGLARRVTDRFDSGLAMAEALQAAQQRAPISEVSTWFRQLAGAQIEERERVISEIDSIDDETTEAVIDGHSSVGVASDSHRLSPKRRLFAGLGVVFVIAATGLILASRSNPRTDAVSTVDARVPAAPSPVVSAATPEHIADEPQPLSTSAPSASVRSRPVSAPIVQRAKSTTAPSSTGPAKSSCDPPYITNSLGHRRWKKECL